MINRPIALCLVCLGIAACAQRAPRVSMITANPDSLLACGRREGEGLGYILHAGRHRGIEYTLGRGQSGTTMRSTDFLDVFLRGDTLVVEARTVGSPGRLAVAPSAEAWSAANTIMSRCRTPTPERAG